MLSSLHPETATDYAALHGGAALNAWPTLLVVDSDIEMTRRLVCYFEKRGFHVAAAASLAEARQFFHRRKCWTTIVSECHLPDGTGAEFCDWIREQGCDAPVLLVSGNPSCVAFPGEIEFMAKPFPLEKLEAFVRAQPHR